MPIALTTTIEEEKIEEMPEVRWQVGVSNDVTYVHDEGGGEGSHEWVAKCDTLDEAVELATSLEKRYFVMIMSMPVV